MTTAHCRRTHLSISVDPDDALGLGVEGETEDDTVGHAGDAQTRSRLHVTHVHVAVFRHHVKQSVLCAYLAREITACYPKHPKHFASYKMQDPFTDMVQSH